MVNHRLDCRGAGFNGAPENASGKTVVVRYSQYTVSLARGFLLKEKAALLSGSEVSELAFKRV